MAAPAPAEDNGSFSSFMKRPEDFGGIDVEGFLIQCRLYILGNARKFPDDTSKVLLALSCCKGDAAEWAKNFAEEALNRPRQANEEVTFGSFENFKTLLKEAFSDPNKQQTAQLELSLFRQKDDMTAVEFFSKFDILARKAGYNQGHDEYLIQLLEHNLQMKLVEKITMLEVPGSYATFKERALKLDAAWRRQQTVFKDRRRGTMPVQNRSPQAPQPQTQPVVQTTRDSTGVTFGGQGQLMDLDKARRLGVCAWCGKAGHIARFCPNRGPRRVRQVGGAEISAQPVTATVTEVVAEVAKPQDANELLLCQLTSVTDLLKNLSERVSSIENQGFGKSQQ